MRINGLNGANTQVSGMKMTQATDSVSKNIQNQIFKGVIEDRCYFYLKRDFIPIRIGFRSFCPKIIKKVSIYEMGGKKNGEEDGDLNDKYCNR